MEFNGEYMENYGYAMGFYVILWKIMIFFKQKTAYEIASCLVGSEMCIRDSCILSSPLPSMHACLKEGYKIIPVDFSWSKAPRKEAGIDTRPFRSTLFSNVDRKTATFPP